VLSSVLSQYQIPPRPRFRTSAFWQRSSSHQRSKILMSLQNASRYFLNTGSILSKSTLTHYGQYKIIHKIRNNSKVTKEELITALADIVPDGHTVSLEDPELVILVVVYKVRRSGPFLNIESDQRNDGSLHGP
jgi:hypothetical protein